MKVEIQPQDGGGLQFIVTAETDAERVVLDNFRKQYQADQQAVIHRFVPGTPSPLGPVGFQFGTQRRRP